MCGYFSYVGFWFHCSLNPDNIQIIEVSPEEARLYQEAYEAEFQMQLDLITDRYNRMQKIKLVSDSDASSE